MATTILTLNSFTQFIGTNNTGTTSNATVGYIGQAVVARGTIEASTSARPVSEIIATPLAGYQVVCQISTGANDFINTIGPQSSGSGKSEALTSYNGQFTFSSPFTLNANTTYYIWFYPQQRISGTKSFGSCSIQGVDYTITINGQQVSSNWYTYVGFSSSDRKTSDSTTVASGSSVTMYASLGSAPSGATLSFDGWYNSSGTRVSTSQTYTVTVSGNATYTAKATVGYPKYYLDVNGKLDGTDSGGISGYGTFSISADGSTLNNQTDYYKQLDYNSYYQIGSITATTGHTFEGYYFYGKRTQSGSYENGTYTSISSTPYIPPQGYITNQTNKVVLVFTTNSYTVTFNANGGSASETSRTIKYGAAYGTLPTASRSGYEFLGWFTAQTGGTQVTATTTYTATTNTTLWAHWKNVGYYYFDLNGWLDGEASGGIAGYGTCDIYINDTKVATGVSDWYQQYQYGSTYRIDNIQATALHTYVGVHSGSLTGTIGDTTTTVVLAFDTASFTVYFNGNGGTPSVSSKSVKYNTVYGGLPTATLDDCKLIGWFTSPVGGTQILPNTAFTRTSSITLYAQWYCNGSINLYHSGQYKNYYIYIYHNGQWVRYAPYIHRNGSFVLHP